MNKSTMKVNGHAVKIGEVWLCRSEENPVVAIITETHDFPGSRPIRGLVHINSYVEPGENVRCGVFYWEEDGKDQTVSGGWDMIRPLLGEEIKFMDFADCIKVPE